MRLSMAVSPKLWSLALRKWEGGANGYHADIKYLGGRTEMKGANHAVGLIQLTQKYLLNPQAHARSNNTNHLQK